MIRKHVETLVASNAYRLSPEDRETLVSRIMLSHYAGAPNVSVWHHSAIHFERPCNCAQCQMTNAGTIKLNGKEYLVRSNRCVSVKTKTGWRSLNGYGRAYRGTEIDAVLAEHDRRANEECHS